MPRVLPAVIFQPEVTRYGLDGGSVLNGGKYSALLISEGHARLPNGAWSGGGPFYCEHASLYHKRYGAYEQMKRFADGPSVQYFSAVGSGGHPALVVPSTSKATLQGALDATLEHSLRGYVNTRPGTSEVDTLVALKELVTDGLPSIPFHAVLKGSLRGLPYRMMAHIRNARLLGGEYLNVVFGWKPFVNDVRKFYKLTYDIDAAVAKLARQNGHRIRRRAILKDVHETTQTSTAYANAYANVYGGTNLPGRFGTAKTLWTKTVRHKERVWYSACYRYWIPNVASPAWNRRARRALFGVTPTPGALYDAMPWSWLIQWAADLSALAHALSPTAVDNLVQLYGYTMRNTVDETICTSAVSYPSRNTRVYSPILKTWVGQEYEGCGATFSSVHKIERKMRFGGISPFGVGTAMDGLTPYQGSILAALGIARM